MTTKTIEIRDKATFLPMLATRLDPITKADRYLLARAGYGTTPCAQEKYVLLASIQGVRCASNYDPSVWNDRTRQIAHRWIIDHFDELESGAVVDVEFILGETAQAKVSEAVQEPIVA
jgi:hypothetical protein